MNQTIPAPKIREYMTRHLADVFETMLSMKAALLAEKALPHQSERLTGSVGFAGERATGAVYLHLSAILASRVASRMLGLAPEELGEPEINDVVGEVTNMLAGGLRSWLCDEGAQCAVSTPGIIRGMAFAIEPLGGVEREFLIFACEDECVAVEIHFKFEN
jgi:chemotaxis protein CheX